jgi:hypothetical protein
LGQIFVLINIYAPTPPNCNDAATVERQYLKAGMARRLTMKTTSFDFARSFSLTGVLKLQKQALICTILMVGGCWTTESMEDGAAICILQESADAPVIIHSRKVSTHSCDKELEMTCAAIVDGETIHIETTQTWKSAEGWKICPDYAISYGFSPCDELDSLPAGTYTIEYAGRQTSITLPNPDEECTL